ncbi:hypothetical protein ADL03_15850 [Nocardia sp. NRRL S-836]|nr:hypothetical protein ADL03_15850 [Nocardia sp. NRRL S-836]
MRSVLELLREYGFGDDEEQQEPLSLEFGTTYTSGEWCRVSDTTDLATRLIAETPEVAFTSYEEPYEDRLGTTCTHVPGLGADWAACDEDGAPVVRRADVLKWMPLPIEVREANLGVPWQTAIAAMPRGTATEPDSFDTWWDRRTADVQVADGQAEGQDLIFVGVGDSDEVDAILAGHGFLRANPWVALDENGPLFRTAIYRSPVN